MPKISVIIPTYNRSDTLINAIKSVLNQTVHDLEIIVVDDGSIDNTKDIVLDIGNSRIKYFYKKNEGVSSSRNYGLQKASGVYIAFLDHDDLWPENYLEVMLNRLESNSDYGVVYSPITVIYPDGCKIDSYKRPKGRSGWLTVDLFKRGFVWTSATVIRKTVLKDINFDESLRKSYEDGDFFLRLSTRCKFLFVGDVEATKNEHDKNLSTQVGILPTRILVLERFYYKLGGKDIIPANVARRRLSHAYRKVAKSNRLNNNKSASIFLYKKAIKYWPFDLRLYMEFIQSIFMSKSGDQNPNWQIPEPLPEISN